MSRSFSTSQLLDRSDDLMDTDALENNVEELAESILTAEPSFNDLDCIVVPERRNKKPSDETVHVRFDSESGEAVAEDEGPDNSGSTIEKLLDESLAGAKGTLELAPFVPAGPFRHLTLEEELDAERNDETAAARLRRNTLACCSAFMEALDYVQEVRSRGVRKLVRMDSYSKISALPSSLDTVCDVEIAARAVLGKAQYEIFTRITNGILDFEKSLPENIKGPVAIRVGAELIHRRIVPLRIYFGKRVQGQRLGLQLELMNRKEKEAPLELSVTDYPEPKTGPTFRPGTIERLETAIIEHVTRLGHIGQQKLFAMMPGHRRAKVQAIQNLVAAGKLKAVKDWKSIRYSLKEQQERAA